MRLRFKFIMFDYCQFNLIVLGVWWAKTPYRQFCLTFMSMQFSVDEKVKGGDKEGWGWGGFRADL